MAANERSRFVVGLVVHEWVEANGGAERVVDELLESLGECELQVLWTDDPHRHLVKTHETWLARTPLRKRKAAATLLMPAVWRNIDRRAEYDWMVVSSHLFAHHAQIRSAPEIPRFVYCHTPARYIWDPSVDQRGASSLARAMSAVLRPVDRSSASKIPALATNSRFTAARISRCWARDDVKVIYPPVRTRHISSVNDWSTKLVGGEIDTLARLPRPFVLGASRFVSYKRLDTVIEVGERCGLPVVLAGSGPVLESLRRRAESALVPVQIIVRPSDALLYALMQAASAFIFPPVEDFGIVPVEAISAGCPVVVNPRGGARESVEATGGGVVAEDDVIESWALATDVAMRLKRSDLPSRANVFSSERFREEVRDWVGEGRSAATQPGMR